MRKIILENLPLDVQRAIRKQAWRSGDMRYEDAVIELIRDLIIERSINYDIAIMEREWRWNDEPF
ncbi:MAG TPA: hypothetical protein VGS96_03255 [Thermoanaerobaculia bacterium]|jgi:hypothetical protein|nr:hypothetical protein [Thermoanaerobaculia bacterium]